MLTGGGNPYFAAAADAVAGIVPNAERRVVEGMGHVPDRDAIAPVLEAFFASGR